ncbi:MAG: SDR family NAD(P)-dependent oxidoreductase [Parvularculaceae bacterium]
MSISRTRRISVIAFMPNRLFCFGYGYTARALARRLAADGWLIAATARSAGKAAMIAEDGAEPVLWTIGQIPANALDDAAAALISAPPNDDGCPIFHACSDALAARADKIGWIGYLSTNGVYGDHGGAWIDETADLKAISARARRRVKAEAEWTGFAVERTLPLVIFRLPGIYGPGRSALDAVRAGRARRIIKEGQVFNRMHVDDIAAALKASIQNPHADALFNLSDDEPTPPQDVIEYACTLLGVAPPPLVPLEDADLSDMARSFYADNKRVRNDRMKEKLGVTLQYPTYREGLDAIFAADG